MGKVSYRHCRRRRHNRDENNTHAIEYMDVDWKFVVFGSTTRTVVVQNDEFATTVGLQATD